MAHHYELDIAPTRFDFHENVSSDPLTVDEIHTLENLFKRLPRVFDENGEIEEAVSLAYDFKNKEFMLSFVPMSPNRFKNSVLARHVIIKQAAAKCKHENLVEYGFDGNARCLTCRDCGMEFTK